MSKKTQQLLQLAGQALNDFDWEQAGAIYAKVLKEQPDNAGALMGVAMLMNRSGQFGDALQVLLRLWKGIQNAPKAEQDAIQNSTKAEILAQMGLALQLLKREDQALELYTEALKLYPSKPLEQRIENLRDKSRAMPVAQIVTKAQRLAAQGMTQQAMEAWREALQMNPDHDVALHGLGDLYRQRREFQLALPLIQQAIIMQPGVALYHNTLGMLFQQKGEFEKALIFHRRALTIDPKYAAAHCNLGVALKNLDRLDDAVLEYNKALKIDPNMPEAHNNLGNLYRLLGRLDDAKASLHRALKLRPGYPDATNNLEALQSMMAAAPRKAAPKAAPKSAPKAAPKKAAAKKPVKPAAKAKGKAKPAVSAKKVKKDKTKAKKAAQKNARKGAGGKKKKK